MTPLPPAGWQPDPGAIRRSDDDDVLPTPHPDLHARAEALPCAPAPVVSDRWSAPLLGAPG